MLSECPPLALLLRHTQALTVTVAMISICTLEWFNVQTFPMAALLALLYCCEVECYCGHDQALGQCQVQGAIIHSYF